MVASAITSVDRSIVSACTTCLLDCVLEVWKRIYEYACAFFDYFFGSVEANTEKLPPPVVALIADYAIDLQNEKELLYIKAEVDRYKTWYSLQFKVKNLTREVATLHFFWEVCLQPSFLLKKIEVLFLTTYQGNEKKDHYHSTPIHIRKFYKWFNNNNTVQAFVEKHQMDQNEAEQAIKLWEGLRTIDCLAKALLVCDEPDHPLRIYKDVSGTTLDWVRISMY